MEGRRTPMRRCISCMQSYPQGELVRLTVRDLVIVRDEGSKNDGRGYYICRKQECLDRAVKKKVFNRILKTNLDVKMIEDVISSIADTEVVN